MNPTSASPTAAVDAAQDSPLFRLAARVGYVVLGLVHVIIGLIAASIAVGAGGGRADQSGAMEQIERVPFGVVGYVAKGVAVAVVGVLFVVAALTHDPEKAGGLDSALRSMAELPFGRVLLWLVGAGLVIYGVYCFARARYARL